MHQASRFPRRGFAALGTIVALAAAAVIVLPAYAVSNTGLFELDGNAVTSHSGSAAPDDWDRVCHDVTAGGQDSAKHATGALCTTAGATNGADALEWVHSASQNEVNFTGGGSKDPQNISAWAYTQGVGGNPGKDILTDGFAAKYHEPSSPNCPTLAGTDGSTTCKVLFFGMDRFDNSGDAQNGFWFLQNSCSLGSNKVGGGNGFACVDPTPGSDATDDFHRAGDILVTTDFSIGGGTSTINVYHWDPTCTKTTGTTAGTCGDANLRIDFTSTAARCSVLTPAIPACGIVNPADGTVAPWPYTDKSGNSTYLNGEFFEGGLNISNLQGLNANACFASVLDESRSSTSTTATLKVFILGAFGACGSKTVTTPSAGSGGSAPINAAASVAETDTANITVTGTSSFGGTVQFSLCFNPAVNCATGGTAIGSPVGVAGSNGSASVVSPTATVTSVGTYCWRAEYSGDPSVGVPPSSDPTSANDGSTSECFSLTPLTPTLKTQAGSSPVLLGSAVTDTATLSGTANQPGSPVINPTTAGAKAGGSITFTLLGPNNCTTVAFTSSAVSVSGDNTYGPVTFTPTAIGTYHWAATYTPDASGNTLGTSHNGACNDTNEDVTVYTIPTGTQTTPVVSGGTVASTTFGSLVTDHAVVTASQSGGPNVTGSVAFFVCNPSQVTANGGTCSTGGTAEGSATLSPNSGANPPSSQADSAAITANILGTWCWRAVYTPDVQAYTGSGDASTGECFTVQDIVGATSNQNWTPNDSATVTSAHGAPLNGTVNVQLYDGSNNCTSGAVSDPAVNKTVSASGQSSVTVTTSNTTYSISAGDTVSWKVTFTSSDPNVSSQSFCTENSSVTINN